MWTQCAGGVGTRGRTGRADGQESDRHDRHEGKHCDTGVGNNVPEYKPEP